MINYSTLDYHVTHFNTLFSHGSGGQMKALNLYGSTQAVILNLNQNHNHDLNLYTIHLIAASALGLAAVQPLDRLLAQAKLSYIQIN